MEILELMKQRHSVRQYKDIAIGPEQRIALNHLIEEINGEAGLHIQIFYDEPQCFRLHDGALRQIFRGKELYRSRG